MPHTPTHKKKKREGIVVKKKKEDLTDPLRPGASPGRRRGSGDPFEPSTTKPKEFSVGGEKVTEEEFKILRAGAGFRRGSGGGILTPEMRERLLRTKLREPTDIELLSQEEQRRTSISEQLGTGELRTELQQQIDQPPSLEPEKVTQLLQPSEEDIKRQKEQRAFIGRLFSGTASREELAREAKNFGKGLAITAGVAGALVGAVAAFPFIAVQAARLSISSKVGGEIAGIVAVGFGLKTAADFERGEIDTAKKIIQGMVEEGERIEADVRNGLDPSFAVNRLREMADQVILAESTIKGKANLNIKYRSGKEYLADIQSIIKAREALRRRVDAIENIAVLGTASLNPEALMLNIAERG